MKNNKKRSFFLQHPLYTRRKIKYIFELKIVLIVTKNIVKLLAIKQCRKL
jgi:hypothetical protein